MNRFRTLAFAFFGRLSTKPFRALGQRIFSLRLRLAAILGGSTKGEDKANSLKAKRAPRPIVQSRPATLEQRYRILHDGELADEVFLRLRRNLYDALDVIDRQKLTRVSSKRVGVAAQKQVFREAGRIAPDRSYFYLKPAGETGLLFERSGAGWVICKAEKIIGQNLFLREGEPVDTVTLYFAYDRPALPRVMSKRLGSDLLPLAVYEQKLRQSLGLDQLA